MLKPSYAELMEVMNKDKESDVTSRYTVVIAAAKRARQLIDGDEPMIDNYIDGKPVSTAVEEIRQGKIHVVPEGQGTVIMPKNSIQDEILSELKNNNEALSEENIEIVEDIEDNEDIEIDEDNEVNELSEVIEESPAEAE